MKEFIISYDSLLILSTIIISKPLDYSKLTRIFHQVTFQLCAVYVKRAYSMLLFSRKLFSFDSLRYENMLLLLAKETSSLLLVLPIWLAGPISASQHKPTSFISFCLNSMQVSLSCLVKRYIILKWLTKNVSSSNFASHLYRVLM